MGNSFTPAQFGSTRISLLRQRPNLRMGVHQKASVIAVDVSHANRVNKYQDSKDSFLQAN